MKFLIDSLIFDKFPNLTATITVIRNFNNNLTEVENNTILEYLRHSEAELRKRFTEKSSLLENENIEKYFQLFRSLGVNPKKVLPSHAALSERVVRGGVLPNINPVVNFYNAFSIKYLVPFGGEDLDKVEDYFTLTVADGTEKWIGIGEQEAISPKEGDIIWRDSQDVSTLTINWRQCDKTKLTKNTTNAYFISEGFSDFNTERIKEVHSNFIKEFITYFGGEAQSQTLEYSKREVDL